MAKDIAPATLRGIRLWNGFHRQSHNNPPILLVTCTYPLLLLLQPLQYISSPCSSERLVQAEWTVMEFFFFLYMHFCDLSLAFGALSMFSSCGVGAGRADRSHCALYLWGCKKTKVRRVQMESRHIRLSASTLASDIYLMNDCFVSWLMSYSILMSWVTCCLSWSNTNEREQQSLSDKGFILFEKETAGSWCYASTMYMCLVLHISGWLKFCLKQTSASWSPLTSAQDSSFT